MVYLQRNILGAFNPFSKLIIDVIFPTTYINLYNEISMYPFVSCM